MKNGKKTTIRIFRETNNRNNESNRELGSKWTDQASMW